MNLLKTILLSAALLMVADVRALELRNASCLLKFSDQTGGCLAIETGKTRFVLPGGTDPDLFEIELKTENAKDTIRLSSSDPCERKFEVEKLPSGNSRLRMRFMNFHLPGEKAAFDVEATVELHASLPRTKWHLSFVNRSRKHAVVSTRFPILRKAVWPGKADLLIPGGNYGGKVFRNNRTNHTATYPSFTTYTQFMGFTDKNGCSLYLGAHDPDARTKTFSVSPDQDISVLSPVTEIRNDPDSGRSPFSFAVDLIPGNWLDMAKHYRAWAEQNAPWLKKGKLAFRKDVPEDFLKAGPWLCIGWMGHDSIIETAENAKKLVGMPLAIHWYVWHVSPFDYDYPDLRPKPGFAEAVKTLRAAGHYPMPYTNGHVWDNNLASFAKAKPWTAKRKDATIHEEVWGTPKHVFSVMCPATDFYQKYLADHLGKFIRENALAALYLDQISAVEPTWCFDPSHGHKQGIGSYWAEGYRKLLGALRRNAGGNTALTSECAQEMYIDSIDGFLTWLPVDSNDVPLLTAVYSGYTTYFGSPTAENDTLDAFAAIQMRALLWGNQLGWEKAFLSYGSQKEKAALLGKLAKLRLRHLDFLSRGEYLGELLPVSQRPVFQTIQNYVGSGGQVRSLATPDVLTAVWRSEDGAIALFLANTRSLPRVFSGKLPERIKAKGDFLQTHDGTAWRTERRVSPGEVFHIALDSYEATVLRLVKTSGSCPATEHFSGELQLEKEKIRVRELPGHLLRIAGEDAKIALQIINENTERTAAVSVTLPDQRVQKLQIAPGSTKNFSASSKCSPGAPVLIQSGGAVCRIASSKVTLPSCSIDFPGKFSCTPGAQNEYPVTVVNRSTQALRGEISIALSRKWRLPEGTRKRITLPPETERVFTIPLLPPQEKRNRSFPARVSVKIGKEMEKSGKIRLFVPKYEAPLPVPRLRDQPKFGGRFDQYEKLPVITIGETTPQQIKIRDYRGNSDLSAKVRIARDRKNFYFFAEVLDDVHHQEEADKHIWRGDGFQLAFLSGTENAPDKPQEFALALTPWGTVLYSYNYQAPSRKGTAQVRREGNRTLYECAIPWEEIGHDPESGKALYWSFALADNDGTASMKGWAELTPGVFGTKNGKEYRRLEFRDSSEKEKRNEISGGRNTL